MKKNMLSGLFALSVMSSALAGDLTDGLVSWFSFEGLDGNGRVENLADAARPLTLKDGTSLTDGSFNGSSALTSDGRLNACGTFDVPAMTNLTFSMWVRRDTDVGTYPDSSYPHLIANVPGGIRIVMDKTAKGATIYVGDPYLSANPALERKIWQHLLMTFEEVSRDDKCSTINYRFYVNGSLAKEELNWKVMRTSGTTTTYGFLGSTGNMNVKLSGNGGNRPFTGLIDEVRFWRRALSREEAAAEYARLSALPEETLVCHWTFDEIAGSGSSRTVADVGRYGATLRLGDGVTATDGVLNGAVKADGYTRSWALFNLPKKMSDMTFCGWVNQSVDSSLDNTTKIGGSNGGPRFFVSGSNYLIFEASPQATSSPSKWSGAVKDEAHVFNPSHPAQGVWFHFALTTHYDYDAANANYLATQCFYVNGEKTSELSFATTTPWWANADQAACLFNQGQGSNRPFEGSVDDLRFYDRVLTAGELATLARGPATVSAGADFSVAGEKATLRGSVGPRGPEYFREGYAGDVRWSLVSAPQGGEGASILVPESETTQVFLPADGAYTFRLAVTAGDAERHDDVTVTRVASAAGSAPEISLASEATVAIPLRLALAGAATGAERVRWSKVSGPDGVWFEPSDAVATKATFGSAGTYVLRLTAENAAGAASADVTVTATATEDDVALDDRLEYHWAMNGGTLLAECVSQTKVSLKPVAGRDTFGEGARRYGLRNTEANDCITTDRPLAFEKTAEGQTNKYCTNEWVTVALWIRPDATKRFDSWSPILFLAWQSLGLRYGRWDNNADGFTQIQQTTGGSNYALYYAAPYAMAGRWVHVCAIYDRATSNGAHELYVDGVKLTAAGTGGSKYPARKMATNIELCGAPGTPHIKGPGFNQALGNYAASTDSAEYKSATFEGVIDDVRVYSRKLNVAEIRTLASRPDFVNFAPSVDLYGETARRVDVKTDEPLRGAAYDDGQPEGSELTTFWRFIGEAPERSAIAYPGAPVTTVYFGKGGFKSLVQMVATDGERTTYSDPIEFDVRAPGFLLFLK